MLEQATAAKLCMDILGLPPEDMQFTPITNLMIPGHDSIITTTSFSIIFSIMNIAVLGHYSDY